MARPLLEMGRPLQKMARPLLEMQIVRDLHTGKNSDTRHTRGHNLGTQDILGATWGTRHSRGHNLGA
eukprot:1155682-Pelagomonas_calceolata.AAC.3